MTKEIDSIIVEDAPENSVCSVCGKNVYKEWSCVIDGKIYCPKHAREYLLEHEGEFKDNPEHGMTLLKTFELMDNYYDKEKGK